MALGLKLVSTTGGIPVYIKVNELAPGGFILDKTGNADGVTLKAGTLMVYDEATRKAKVVKTATAQAALTAGTALKLLKGHIFVAGDLLKAVAITSIDTTNAAYDTVTMSGNITVTVGEVVASEVVTTAGGNTGLLYEEVAVADNQAVDVVIAGTAYARRILPVTKAQIPATINLSNSK